MPNKAIIFFCVLLDCLGQGLVLPILPDLFQRFHIATSSVHVYLGVFILIYSMAQFIAAPLLGTLSDRFGRKPILMLSLLGSTLDYCFMAFAPSITWLIVGRWISGLTGANMAVASSYLADISPASDRAARFSLIGAAYGAGLILGPILGYSLLSLGCTNLFAAVAILSFANFAIGILFLGESLPLPQRRKISKGELNPLISLSHLWQLFSLPGNSILVLVFFLFSLSGQVHHIIWSLFTREKFLWSAEQIYGSLSFVGVEVILAQLLLARKIIPVLGEKRSLLIGMSTTIGSMVLYALVPQGWMLYPVIIFSSLNALAGPSLQALISMNVPKNYQGQLQGRLVSLGSLAALLAPMVYMPTFNYFSQSQFSSTYLGSAYILAAMFMALALMVWLAELYSTKFFLRSTLKKAYGFLSLQQIRSKY